MEGGGVEEKENKAPVDEEEQQKLSSSVLDTLSKVASASAECEPLVHSVQGAPTNASKWAALLSHLTDSSCSSRADVLFLYKHALATVANAADPNGTPEHDASACVSLWLGYAHELARTNLDDALDVFARCKLDRQCTASATFWHEFASLELKLRRPRKACDRLELGVKHSALSREEADRRISSILPGYLQPSPASNSTPSMGSAGKRSKLGIANKLGQPTRVRTASEQQQQTDTQPASNLSLPTCTSSGTTLPVQPSVTPATASGSTSSGVPSASISGDDDARTSAQCELKVDSNAAVAAAAEAPEPHTPNLSHEREYNQQHQQHPAHDHSQQQLRASVSQTKPDEHPVDGQHEIRTVSASLATAAHARAGVDENQHVKSQQQVYSHERLAHGHHDHQEKPRSHSNCYASTSKHSTSVKGDCARDEDNPCQEQIHKQAQPLQAHSHNHPGAGPSSSDDAHSKMQQRSCASLNQESEDSHKMRTQSSSSASAAAEGSDAHGKEHLQLQHDQSQQEIDRINHRQQQQRTSSQQNSAQRAKETDKYVQLGSRVYTKLSVVGTGGTSKVYKTVHNSRMYALKRVKMHGLCEEAKKGLEDEVNLLKRLRGRRNIIQLVDCEIDKSAGLIYMVLEFGEIDLAVLLAQREEWQRKRASSTNDIVVSSCAPAAAAMRRGDNFVRLYFEEMVEAVGAIHEERIVHSDLKPANFMSVCGTLKLIDFGIARAISQPSHEPTNIVREQQVGTLNYMSPEAVLNGSATGPNGEALRVGRASDIWSLGCILYRMVYGTTPFDHVKGMIQKMQAITDMNHGVHFPEIAGLSHDAHLVHLMKGCLAKQPSERLSIQSILSHPFLLPPVSPSITQPSLERVLAQVLQHCASNGEESESLSKRVAAKAMQQLGQPNDRRTSDTGSPSHQQQQQSAHIPVTEDERELDLHAELRKQSFSKPNASY